MGFCAVGWPRMALRGWKLSTAALLPASRLSEAPLCL